MVVTDLKKIDDKRWCLYLDYESFGPVYKSDIRRLKLKVGNQVEEAKMEQFREDLFGNRAMNKVIASIKYSEKCEYDIRKKLKDLHYDQEIVESTMAKLKEYGYVDDARYAELYIRSHVRKKSRFELAHHLGEKHIPEEFVEEALANQELPSEKEVLTNLLLKKYAIADMEEKREKVIAAMYRKGFPLQLVKECIEELSGAKDEFLEPC